MERNTYNSLREFMKECKEAKQLMNDWVKLALVNLCAYADRYYIKDVVDSHEAFDNGYDYHMNNTVKGEFLHWLAYTKEIEVLD